MLFKYRLQFFAEGSGGEKTEEASSKKLSDARGEGQAAKSQDLIIATALLTLFTVLKIYVGSIGTSFIEAFTKYYNNIDKYAKEDITVPIAQGLLQDSMITIGKMVLPIALAALIVGVSVNIFQVKWKPTIKTLQPKFSKLNPLTGFKKILSKDKLVELLKEVIKIGVIVYISYDALKDHMDILLKLYDMELYQSVFLIGNMVISLGLNISYVFIVIGFADYMYQKLKFKNDMKMTKQEVKDEYKNSEGDPQIKSKIRGKMREASQRRMMQRLPEADVVITNPTHFAAAIKYDKTASEAPILVAKGADFLAQKIKEVARENKIEIVENKPLARMLYYNVELEQEIPPELYQMTAEVLAYVYNLKNNV
jgi:flagellar biosynthesis protein FlhB